MKLNVNDLLAAGAGDRPRNPNQQPAPAKILNAARTRKIMTRPSGTMVVYPCAVLYIAGSMVRMIISEIYNV